MNRGEITAGIVTAACSAYTPPTAEAPSIRRVQFKISARDSFRAESFWTCEVEGNAVLMDFLEREGTPGRGVKLEYELATRPFYKYVGRTPVQSGEIRFLRVFAAEINGQRIGAPQQMEARV